MEHVTVVALATFEGAKTHLGISTREYVEGETYTLDETIAKDFINAKLVKKAKDAKPKADEAENKKETAPNEGKSVASAKSDIPASK